jgi:hypothetical protein
MQWMITAAEAKTLPLPHRLAWVCSVATRVGGLFSPYARRKYYLDDISAAVWHWIQKGRSARARCRQLLGKLNMVDDHFDFPPVSDGELDEEGYRYGFACLGICLLNELEQDDGGPASTGAVNAAWCYAAHILFCHGVGDGGPFLRGDTLTELARPAHQFVRLAFDTALAHRSEPVERKLFDGLSFDAALPRVPGEVLDRVRTRPPPAEIDFLQATGRYVGEPG